MDKALVKRAYSEAEESLKEKQVEEVKRIVLKTLEKIDALKKDKDRAHESVKDIEEKIKLLKMDLDDLKEGRLDRLAERQEKDEKAKQTSVVIIIKEREVVREVSPWYWPWRVVWSESYPTPSWTYTGGAYASGTMATAINGTALLSDSSCYGNATISTPTISCSSAKWGAAGAYQVGDDIINLR